MKKFAKMSLVAALAVAGMTGLQADDYCSLQKESITVHVALHEPAASFGGYKVGFTSLGKQNNITGVISQSRLNDATGTAHTLVTSSRTALAA